jgi:hypothetical protein
MTTKFHSESNEGQKMTDSEFLAIGSITDSYRAHDVGDIDLVVPEFTDNRIYTAAVSLEAYEKLAEATGKPIDLKLSPHASDLNLTGGYNPEDGRWYFFHCFCGSHWFSAIKPMTFQQIVDEVARTRGSTAPNSKSRLLNPS